MNIAFLQFSNKSNEQYTKLTKLSKEINSKYCEINHYHYIYEEIDSSIKEHDMYFHKFEMILKYIDQYDYIVWCDIDAIPINPNKTIESILDNKHEIFISKDVAIRDQTKFLKYIFIMLELQLTNSHSVYLPDLKNFFNFMKDKQGLPAFNFIWQIACNPHGFCNGFFILKSTQIVKNIIQNCLNSKKLFKNIIQATVYDQDAFCLFLQPHENIIQIYSPKFHGNMQYLETNIKDEFSYDEENNFICHMYSLSIENRIKGLELIKNNKFWKPIFNK